MNNWEFSVCTVYVILFISWNMEQMIHIFCAYNGHTGGKLTVYAAYGWRLRADKQQIEKDNNVVL